MRETTRPFGRTLTAMITPFDARGELDVAGAKELANYLVEEQKLDGLVLNGTTGESPTTSDEEKAQLVRAVVDAVGDRAHIIAGASTYDTRHSVKLAKQAADAGAHGLLLVTPYYSRPPQEGIEAHFTTIADATELPCMLYDIPPRSCVPITGASFHRLVEHDRIIAVKDATADISHSQRVRVATGLRFYCGVDALNLAAYATGQDGIVSVIAHLVGKHLVAMFDAFDAGDVARASEINDRLLPALHALQGPAQGVIAVKAALKSKGLPAGAPRLPMPEADNVLLDMITENLSSIEVK
ncbi:4-hydroxy-tetrahydrodipicolinate synthase [Natronoglycomyces albus]|uniref:4-hydroxy-tetrahydrodipicolinate synthase n=1 Tax=Natronoglycomyces albus TaxID=2811108 RepID=A0A895XEQ1_9ACTN|nr:4-hydroxy-tetrahydrodipicolinate synthase [Natronoglycomyces albus]QSB04311.1 4-hydroxy-tetrahydrodipicolinate synthase [Natronoglycomyces albus]